MSRLARTYVPAAIVDEVVPETWMAVVKSIDSFEGRSALKTSFYRIILNKFRTIALRCRGRPIHLGGAHARSTGHRSIRPDTPPDLGAG